MKVWELLEHLKGVDPDRVVAIAHNPGQDAGTIDDCDPDPPCMHFAELDETKFALALPVFVLGKGEPIL